MEICWVPVKRPAPNTVNEAISCSQKRLVAVSGLLEFSIFQTLWFAKYAKELKCACLMDVNQLSGSMSQTIVNSGDQLANALYMLGVNFIMGGTNNDESLHKQPARLIAALVQSSEARLRLSLIPLFLEHPEFAVHVRVVAGSLDPSARLTLQCYYSAAVWLAKKYQVSGASLPDYFSGDLSLNPVDDPDENLRMLAKCHKVLSGSYVNWLGTYQHAGQVWQKGLEYRKG